MSTDTKTAAASTKPLVDYQTIDADGHTVFASTEWWKPYMPEKYWEWAPKPVTEPNQEGNFQCEGRIFKLPFPYPGAGDSASLGGLMTPGGWRLEDLSNVTVENARKAGGALAEDRLRAMDADGVAVAYLYPSEMLSLPWAIISSHFAAVVTRAHNDWLADYCKADPHRLRGAALLPQQDLMLAVEEMERAKKNGLPTVMLRPNPINGLKFDHPNYDRLWATAIDLDIGIGIHEGFGVEMPTIGNDRSNNWLEVHALEHPTEHMAACMAFTMGGVLQRFPKLRVGFLESGAGWAGFWLNRLDEHYEKFLRFYPGLDLLPSEYFKRQCFLGIEPDYELIPHLVEQGLEDTMVFSSDFPHFDAIYPGSVAALVERDDLSDETKRKLLRDNPLRLYGVDS